MSLSPREEIASATMIATHELVSNLIRAKAAMENLVHELSDFLVLVTEEGRIIWGNTLAADWLSVPRDILHEHSIEALFDDELWPEISRLLKNVGANGPEHEEYKASLELKGEARDILFQVRPFRAVSDRRGKLILFSGHDITEILKARSEQAKLEAELATAQILQQRFLPSGQDHSKHLNVASYYEAADQCSGDWWGHFHLADDVEIICIADVTGHGAASALVTAMTHALCLSFVDRHKGERVSPSALLSEINGIVCRTFRGDMYMTFFCVVFDFKAGTALASNAAHNYPFILRAGKEEKQNPEAILVAGNPIGHDEATKFSDLSFPIHPRDRFIFYTDGLTECRNPARKMYGAGSFRRSILRHQKESIDVFRDRLIQDVEAFSEGESLADDLTLAIFELRDVDAAHAKSL